MSGDGDPKFDDPSLKGLSRYFNSSTIRGRANVKLDFIPQNNIKQYFLGDFSNVCAHVCILHLQKDTQNEKGVSRQYREYEIIN